MAGARLTGSVKSYSAQKGYGFINCPEVVDLYGTTDVFLHVKELEAVGVEGVGVGDEVEFTLAEDKGKPQARELNVPSSSFVGGGKGGKGGKGGGKSWGMDGWAGVESLLAAAASRWTNSNMAPSVNSKVMVDWSNPKASMSWGKGTGGGMDGGMGGASATRHMDGKLTQQVQQLVGETGGVVAGEFAKDGSLLVQMSLNALNVVLKAAGVDAIANPDIPNETDTLPGFDGNKVAGPWFHGTLKQYFPEQAYGFIESAAFKEQFGDKECFIHADHIDPEGNGNLRVKVGEEVYFPLVEDEDGNAWAWAPIIPKSKSFLGYVKSWRGNEYQGFGLLHCDLIHSVFGEDVYCHGQPAEYGGCSISVGSPIVFNLHLSKEGKPQASTPRPPGADLSALPGKFSGKGAKGGAKGGGKWGGDDDWLSACKGFLKGKGFFGGGDMWGGKGDGGAPPAKKRKVDHNPVDDTMYCGYVKSFNPDKGYGFIMCDETHTVYGRDVFVHHAIYAQAGVEVGASVAFQVSLNNEGHPQACSMMAQ